MCDQDKHIREGKAYALALGTILFSIPGTAAIADLYGIQDKRLVVYGCCFLLILMAWLVVQKSEVSNWRAANKQPHQERPGEQDDDSLRSWNCSDN